MADPYLGAVVGKNQISQPLVGESDVGCVRING